MQLFKGIIKENQLQRANNKNFTSKYSPYSKISPQNTYSALGSLSRQNFGMSRLSRLGKRRGSKRNGATFLASAIKKCTFKDFAIEVETARLSRPRRRRRDFSDQDGYGATFQTEADTARLRNNSMRPWWMRRDFSNQSGDNPDHGAQGATFRTKT